MCDKTNSKLHSIKQLKKLISLNENIFYSFSSLQNERTQESKEQFKTAIENFTNFYKQFEQTSIFSSTLLSTLEMQFLKEQQEETDRSRLRENQDSISEIINRIKNRTKS